jgi:hypothetical protein
VDDRQLPPGVVSVLSTGFEDGLQPWLDAIALPAPDGWERLAPDGRLADGIATHPADLLTDDEVLAGIAGLERIASWVTATQTRLMAEFATRRPHRRDPHGRLSNGSTVDEFAGEEIAAALTLAPSTGRRRLDWALTLAERLPRTLTAMERGEVTYAKALAIHEETSHLPTDALAGVERKILPGAADKTPGQLRRIVKQAVLDVDADSAQKRAEKARTERRVGVDAGADGMATFWAVLPAADALGLYARLSDLAHTNRGADDRSMDQLRADALVDLVWENAGSAAAPLVQIVVTEATLTGQDDTPAELLGYGPITAQTARRIAADGVWQALHADFTGAITGVGQKTYRPSAALARLIRARDRTCRWFGCRHPARTCDIDHTLHYPAGKTVTCNLACLCRRHHRVKTRDENRKTGWKMTQEPSGAITWTSPTGRAYVTQPHTIPKPAPPTMRRERTNSSPN